MPRCIAVGGHQPFAKISLGSQTVVRWAAKRQIRGAVLAAQSKSLEVMHLQEGRFAATLASRVDVAAAPGVAFVDFTPQRRRNMSTPSAAHPHSISHVCQITAPARVGSDAVFDTRLVHVRSRR